MSQSDVSVKEEVVDRVQPVAGSRDLALAPIAEQQKYRTLFTYEEGQKIVRRVDWHILPLFMLAYMVKALDQFGVTYAKTMNPKKHTNIVKQLNMTTDQYAYLSTVFTVFILVAEIPSTMLFKISGPRLHYARIVIAWSVACACQAAAYNFGGLMAARAFLGLFEAGLAPGLFLHLTYWYRPDELGPRHAMISALYQFANIFNAFLSYRFTFADGRGGLSGWQANVASGLFSGYFLVQGLIGICLGVALWFYMPEYPENSKWLSEDEQAFVVGRLPASAARGGDENFNKAEFWDAVKDPVTLLFGIGLILFQSGLLGYQCEFSQQIGYPLACSDSLFVVWLPSIIKGFNITGTAATQLLNIPPAFLYWVGGVLGSWVNDRATSVPRALMFIMVCSVWAALQICLAFVLNKAALYAIVCLASIFSAWSFNVWMNWRAQSLKGSTHAAYTISFMNFASQSPGLYTAQIFRSQYAPRYTIPFMVCLAMTLASMVVVAALWYLTNNVDKETRRIAALRREVGKRDNVVLEEDAGFFDSVMHRNDKTK